MAHVLIRDHTLAIKRLPLSSARTSAIHRGVRLVGHVFYSETATAPLGIVTLM